MCDTRFSLSFILFMVFFSGMIATAAVAQRGTLVVLNKSEATCSLLSLPSGKIVATLPTGDGPHEVAVSPDGRTAVVSNYGRRGHPGHTLTVIDIPARKVVKTIDLGEYRSPHGIVYLPDGRRVLVTCEGNKKLLMVNVAAAKVEAAISTGQKVSHMVVVSPRLQRAFVANIGSGTVTAIDVAKRRKIKDIATGRGSEGIALSPDEKELWVTNRADDNVAIVDPVALKIVAKLQTGKMPIRVKFTPDGRYALVSNARSGDVSVYSVRRRRELRRIPMQVKAAADTSGRLFAGRMTGPVPVGVLIPPSGKRAFIANTNADQITVIDLEKWKVVGRLQAGREPDGMAFSKQVY